MTVPDWQLPPGVDRGLWDYLHSGEMVRGYDGQMAASPLATADVAFCERVFETLGRLIDLGCGTGRLCVHFARKGFNCVGVRLGLRQHFVGQVHADAVEALPREVDAQPTGAAPEVDQPAESLEDPLTERHVGGR